MTALSSYITLDEAVLKLCSKCPEISELHIREFLVFANATGMISVLEYQNQNLLLKSDFQKKENFLIYNCIQLQKPFLDIPLDSFFQRPIYYGNRTYAVVNLEEIESYEYVILQNLIFLCEYNYSDSDIDFVEHNFVGIKICTRSSIINEYLIHVSELVRETSRNQSSIFANSAYYMGNKSSLSPFIVSIIDYFKPPQMPVLDLMCGSGAVSSAISNISPVFASDAQSFCTLLASIQGKSNSIHGVSEILTELKPFYIKNYNFLSEKYSDQLMAESSLFHMDYSSSGNSAINEELLNKYQEYVGSVELYSSDAWKTNTSELHKLISSRKENTNLFPYCLFTTYFSNIYVGLMQAIQIDSVRFAIDQLSNSIDRQWALGALVVTCSALGTSFGGHFAQPKNITEKNIGQVLRIRNKSILHEFSKRLQVLMEESYQHEYEIARVPGPWENALRRFSNMDNLFVYIDAPYKREEYSRYYHLLETLVLYNYPESEGKGRISSKRTNERFASEFFTHTQEKINSLFFKILSQILSKNWSCAWSYSNNGAASLVEIVHQIKENVECDVRIYQTPYLHMNHGKAIKGSGKRPVLEYVLVFQI